MDTKTVLSLLLTSMGVLQTPESKKRGHKNLKVLKDKAEMVDLDVRSGVVPNIGSCVALTDKSRDEDGSS